MGADGGGVAKIDIDTSGRGRSGPLIHLVCQGGACLGAGAVVGLARRKKVVDAKRPNA